MELSKSQIEACLERWPVGRMATRAVADDRPHLVPVVFARADGVLWTPIDGKPKRAGAELARVANVRAHGVATLLLDEYAEDWSQLWWVRLDCSAGLCTGSDAGTRRALDALRAKYPQYANTSLGEDAPRLLRLVPERVVSWCAGPLALPDL